MKSASHPYWFRSCFSFTHETSQIRTDLCLSYRLLERRPSVAAQNLIGVWPPVASGWRGGSAAHGPFDPLPMPLHSPALRRSSAAPPHLPSHSQGRCPEIRPNRPRPSPSASSSRLSSSPLSARLGVQPCWLLLGFSAEGHHVGLSIVAAGGRGEQARGGARQALQGHQRPQQGHAPRGTRQLPLS